MRSSSRITGLEYFFGFVTYRMGLLHTVCFSLWEQKTHFAHHQNKSVSGLSLTIYNRKLLSTLTGFSEIIKFPWLAFDGSKYRLNQRLVDDRKWLCLCWSIIFETFGLWNPMLSLTFKDESVRTLLKVIFVSIQICVSRKNCELSSKMHRLSNLAWSTDDPKIQGSTEGALV